MLGVQVGPSVASRLSDVAWRARSTKSEIIRRSLEYCLPRFESGEIPVIVVAPPRESVAQQAQ